MGLLRQLLSNDDHQSDVALRSHSQAVADQLDADHIGTTWLACSASRRTVHSAFLDVGDGAALGRHQRRGVNKRASTAFLDEYKLPACPKDWEGIGPADLCMAPKWYAGTKAKDPYRPEKYDQYTNDGCPLLQSFRGWTDEMKHNAAHRCNYKWCGCQADEDQDNLCRQLDLSSCPRRWRPQGYGKCAPPLDAQSECKVTQVASMSTEQKIKWASDCKVEWPCVGQVEEDEIHEVPRAASQIPVPGGPGPVDADGHTVMGTPVDIEEEGREAAGIDVSEE